MASPHVPRLAAAAVLLAVPLLLAGCSLGPGLASGTSSPKPTSTSFVGGASDAPSGDPSATPNPSGSPDDDLSDPTASSLFGTTWSGTESTGDPLVVNFNADGTFTYVNTGVPDDPDHAETWKLEGMKITLSFNDGFALDQGLLDDDTMNGSGSNTKGETWTWTMTKQK